MDEAARRAAAAGCVAAMLLLSGCNGAAGQVPVPGPTGSTEGAPSEFPGVILSGGALPRWQPSAADPAFVGPQGGGQFGPCPDQKTWSVATTVVRRVECPARPLVEDKSAADAGAEESVLRDGIEGTDRGALGRVVVRWSLVENQIAAGAMLIEHNLITSKNDGITPTGGTRGLPSLIQYNRIERDGSRVEERHHDGIQLWQGGNVVIRRNYIAGFQTSAILIKSDQEQVAGDGTIKHVLIEENYLSNATGYYSLYVREGPHGRPQFVTVKNNVFGPGRPITTGAGPADRATFVRSEEERDAGIAAGIPDAAEWIVWSGNIDAETGQEILPPGGWRAP